ncbi:UDP-Glc:alpha-D-GlcNAc-diphosphoundecaprenol beta-1,3-glucosyltransferase WfgD [Providencia manganoxydans]|uniref:glycosyltransferase family 2 protein n=1 Tax=Providencia TaxID=586 RepID=UPI00214DE350|nr:glycosyltransferase family 2 protein [Providencia stuartii]
MKATVSIIMPAYNAEKTIETSISSVLNQTFTDFILYVIDDASTDNTKSIILNFSDSRIIYLKNECNKGVAISRNKGIELSNSKYIAFLDSDDLWLPEKLQKQINYLEYGWDVVNSNYYSFKDDENILLSTRKSPKIISYSHMLKSNFIGNLTGIYNCEKIGKILQKNNGHEDYIMWLEIVKKSTNSFCIQEPLAKYRLSESSLSGNKFKAMKWQWNIYRNELNFNVLKSSYLFIHYTLNAIKKRR